MVTPAWPSDERRRVDFQRLYEAHGGLAALEAICQAEPPRSTIEIDVHILEEGVHSVRGDPLGTPVPRRTPCRACT